MTGWPGELWGEVETRFSPWYRAEEEERVTMCWSLNVVPMVESGNEISCPVQKWLKEEIKAGEDWQGPR